MWSLPVRNKEKEQVRTQEMSTPSEQEISEIVRKVIANLPQGAPTSVAPASTPEKTVAIGADHGGFPLKEALKPYLTELGYTFIDCGTNSTAAVDYPDLARAVAELVSGGKAFRGVMIDGAGIGSCMTANKVPGVRASMCYDISTASNAREHNDANLLTLGAGLIGESLAKQILKTWLSTPFGGGRHAKRVDKIMETEKFYMKEGRSS
jgi:ribose 5-phosphate isomerase B